MLERLKHISPKILVLTDQGVVSATSFLTNVIIARSLGVSDFGKFSVILLIQVFLLSLQQAVSSGIFQVMFPTLDDNTKRRYTNGVFYLQVIMCTLLFVFGYAACYFFRNTYVDYRILFLPALLGTFLFLLQDLLRKMLLTVRREANALLIDVITGGLQLIIISLYAFKASLTLPIACWIIALTFIPSVIFGIIWVKPGFFHVPDLRLVAGIHKKQSPWMLMSALLQWFSGNFFVVASGLWLGVAALGALRLSQYIFGLLNVLIQAIENYAIPHASGLQTNLPLLNRFLKNLLKTTFLVFAPLLLLISLFSSKILVLTGGTSYSEYGFILHGLSAIYVLILIGIPLRILLRIKLLNQIYFIGYLIASAFSMITARWLISSWQLSGVLTGLFCTQLIVVLLWIYALNKKNMLTWKLFTSY